MSANVATVVRWDATTVDNDAENDEPSASDDLDQGQDKFHLTISADSKDLDTAQEDQEYRDPHTDVNVVAPILNGDGSSREFER